MSMQYEMSDSGVKVTVTDKQGKMTAVTHAYEKAMDPKQFVQALARAMKAAPSVRQAAVSFIHHIQTTGYLDPWKGGDKHGKVAKELLAKMRDLEDSIGVELGLSAEAIKEMRTPGQYADTRSLALKCWVIGVPLQAGVEKSTGIPNLITVSAMRQIVQANRATPEPTTVGDILDKLEKALEKDPSAAGAVIGRMNTIMSFARSLLDSATKQVIDEAAKESEITAPKIPEVGEALV